MFVFSLIISASAKGSERRDFLQEIEMMKKVSEGQNPHVVAMVGCVTVQEPLSLITEFVPYGNLLNYLRTNRRMVHVDYVVLWKKQQACLLSVLV